MYVLYEYLSSSQKEIYKLYIHAKAHKIIILHMGVSTELLVAKITIKLATC